MGFIYLEYVRRMSREMAVMAGELYLEGGMRLGSSVRAGGNSLRYLDDWFVFPSWQCRYYASLSPLLKLKFCLVSWGK